MAYRWRRHPARELHVNRAGVALIAGFEGFVGHPYKPVPQETYWTWGYGHYGDDVPSHGSISRREAWRLLKREDIPEFADGVRELVEVPLYQFQFNALVSLAFNIGLGAFASSTLLRKLNAGDRRGAAAEFIKWTYGAGGERLLGLVRRRRRERRMFNRAYRRWLQVQERRRARKARR